MLGFIKNCFSTGLTFVSILKSVNSLSAIPLSCISINNQECKLRPQIVNDNSKESVFFSSSIRTSKRSGSCNNINDP